MAISTPQRVHNSLAFLKSPDLRFEKVTCKFLSLVILVILVISTLWRPLLFLTVAIREVTQALIFSRAPNRKNGKKNENKNESQRLLGSSILRKISEWVYKGGRKGFSPPSFNLLLMLFEITQLLPGMS